MGRPKNYDRNDVLERATRLFWEKGYEGAHLRELVEVTGISRFSLYQEFGGKQGLFEEALSSYIAGLADLGAVLGREPLGTENIRAFYRAFLDYGFDHGCFAINTIREKSIVPASTFDAVRELVRGVEQALRHNLEAARETGEIPPDVDVEARAKLFAACNMGLLNYGMVEPDARGLESIVSELGRLWK